MKKVAVVILNYNGKKWLEKFLPNVLQHCTYDWCDVVVADNASTDDSVDFLVKNYSSLKLIVLDKNTGYAGGYNRALAQLPANYFVLLNSDVELSENWLPPLVEFMDAHPEVGAIQPVIRSYHEPDKFEYAGASGGFIDYLGYPFCRGRIFESIERDQNQYNQNIECHWASGACLFIRSEVFVNAGQLDDDFFAHMEEIDLCWRVRMLGYKVYTITNSHVYHVGGGTLPQGNPRKTYLNFRNSLYMIFKNELGWKMPFKIYARLVLDGLAGAQALFLKGNINDVIAILKAHFHFYMAIPSLMKKRKNIKKSSVSSYSSSIVLKHFLFNKKYFSEL